MKDALEARLRSLRTPTPPGLRERVLIAARSEPDAPTLPLPATGRAHLQRAAVAAVAIALVLVAGNTAALQLSPTYAATVGGTPWLGPLGRAFGIVPTNITASGQTVTAAGHTVRLLGVEANPLETIVLVQIDNQPTSIGKGDPTAIYPMQATLTDQFGTQYEMAETAFSNVLVFTPISGPAATLGAHLTLSLQRIGGPGATSSSGGVRGPWTFTFDSSINPLQALPAVAPLRTSQVTCTIGNLGASGNYLSFTATYTGPLVQAALAGGPTQGDYSFVQPTVQDASGSTVPVLAVPSSDYYATLPDGSGVQAGWSGILPGAGTYTVSCSPPGTGVPTATIQVP